MFRSVKNGLLFRVTDEKAKIHKSRILSKMYPIANKNKMIGMFCDNT